MERYSTQSIRYKNKIKNSNGGEIFWPADSMFYQGNFSLYDEAMGKHCIEYNDEDMKKLKMIQETCRPKSPDTVNGHNVELNLGAKLEAALKKLTNTLTD